MEFKLRAGLNSGTVVVGAIGDDLRMDYTAVGDTTNLAARMESMAAPGTVLVSENTYKLARDTSNILVPDNIQGIIAARLDRVEENLKKILFLFLNYLFDRNYVQY